MPFKQFRGGKLPPQRHLKIPALGDFMDKATTWPAVPAKGWESAVDPSAWGMLGNDQWGDCAAAGIMHLVQAQSANAGNPLHSTTDQTLALYSAVTGFDPKQGPPGNNPTDNGTVLTQMLAWIQKNGLEMFDASGKTVTVEIVGSASLDISSVAQMRYSSYLFGGNYLGFNCPEQCESDLSNWNFGPGLPIAGGHCVPRVGEGAAGGKIISWSQVIPFSNPFWFYYGDEGYVIVTKAWLNDQGKSPTGVDLDGLVAAMKTL